MARRSTLYVALVVVAALAAPVLSGAQDLKIGVVDVQKCLNDSRMGKKYRQELASKSDQIKAELEAEEKEIKSMRDELEKQGTVLSETARGEKEKAYKERTEAFKEKYQASVRDMQQMDKEFTRKAFLDLQKIVQQIAESGGYALVVEKQEGGVIYAPPSADLTDEVVRRYDQSAKAE